MKVACIGAGWYPESPGGLEKYVYGLNEALLGVGDSVDLFLVGNPVHSGERGRAYSLGQPQDSLWKRMLDARLAFAKSFREPYDVINLHFAMNALPLLPFIKHRTARVVHFHGPWGAESRAEGGGNFSVFVKESLERFVYLRSDSFIVLSSAFKKLLLSYGVRDDQVHVIPMGIDCTFFTPATDRSAVRARLGWDPDATIFFTARRLVNRVGVRELVSAARIVRDSYPNVLVKIAGKGPLRAELEAEILSLGLSDCVELLGYVSEEKLGEAYQAADVTILPSQSLEGFGTIISESLACGTPVIVTPVGGMPDAVSPLADGLVTRSTSPHDIAERMNAVASGRLALPKADVCREYALKHYEWSVVVEQIRAVFREAARRDSSPI